MFKKKKRRSTAFKVLGKVFLYVQMKSSQFWLQHKKKPKKQGKHNQPCIENKVNHKRTRLINLEIPRIPYSCRDGCSCACSYCRIRCWSTFTKLETCGTVTTKPTGDADVGSDTALVVLSTAMVCNQICSNAALRCYIYSSAQTSTYVK